MGARGAAVLEIEEQMKTSAIKKRETIRQSSMPGGLSGTMAPQACPDLVEFLATLKAAPLKKCSSNA